MWGHFLKGQDDLLQSDLNSANQINSKKNFSSHSFKEFRKREKSLGADLPPWALKSPKDVRSYRVKGARMKAISQKGGA